MKSLSHLTSVPKRELDVFSMTLENRQTLNPPTKIPKSEVEGNCKMFSHWPSEMLQLRLQLCFPIAVRNRRDGRVVSFNAMIWASLSLSCVCGDDGKNQKRNSLDE